MKHITISAILTGAIFFASHVGLISQHHSSTEDHSEKKSTQVHKQQPTGQSSGHSEGASVSAEAALEKLVTGNNRFQKNSPSVKTRQANVKKFATSQHPYAAVLTCSDSRLTPEEIFDTDLGDVFVVRDAGNVFDMDEIGSVEYAVAHLGVRLITIVGHTSCGAITAACDHVQEGHITDLVKQIEPALVRIEKETFASKAEKVTAAVRANVQYQAEYVLKNSDIIRQKVEEGSVKIVGMIYSIETGKAEVITHLPQPSSGHAKGISPSQAWTKLMNGYERFMADKPHKHNYSQEVASTAKGQHPHAVVVACADSRVSPEIIFDSDLGEIFTVRNAGNVTDIDAVASAEYAVEHLGATLIVVMGHTKCGAVSAACDHVREGHITDVVKDIEPALVNLETKKYADKQEKILDAVHANIAFQIQHMLKISPLLQEKVAHNELKIIGAMYNIENAALVLEK